ERVTKRPGGHVPDCERPVVSRSGQGRALATKGQTGRECRIGFIAWVQDPVELTSDDIPEIYGPVAPRRGQPAAVGSKGDRQSPSGMAPEKHAIRGARVLIRSFRQIG